MGVGAIQFLLVLAAIGSVIGVGVLTARPTLNVCLDPAPRRLMQAEMRQRLRAIGGLFLLVLTGSFVLIALDLSDQTLGALSYVLLYLAPVALLVLAVAWIFSELVMMHDGVTCFHGGYDFRASASDCCPECGKRLPPEAMGQ